MNGKRLFDRNELKINFMKDETFMTQARVLLNIKETQYYVLELLMILSYNEKSSFYFDVFSIVDDIVNIVRVETREKIMRLCVTILKNLIDNKYTFSMLSLLDMEKIFESEYKDPELQNEKQEFRKCIKFQLKNISHIQYYFRELFSGKLEESPFHYDNTFWESHTEELLNNSTEIIKAIKKYLKSSNTSVVCISANDLYHLLRVCPDVIALVNKYGIKDDLFFLTGSDNEM